MALVLADRVRETTTTAGTGTITLLGAVPSCQSFAVVGNGNTTYYTIVAYTGTEWEVGIGTYTSSGTTLSRDTVLSSSNGGSLVNFSAGTKDVFVDYPAGKAVTTDTLAYPPAIGGTTPAAGTFTTLTATGISYLGGAVGSEVVRVSSGTNTGKYTNFTSDSASNSQIVGATAGANLVLFSSSTNSIKLRTNGAAGSDQAVVSHTASAVNYVQVTGAATGARPTISAQGSDATIDLSVSAKSTGQVLLQGGQVTSQASFYAGTNLANYFVIDGRPSGTGPRVKAVGSDTNVNFQYYTQGTGNFLFYSANGSYQQFGISGANNSVNYLQAAGSVTGQGVQFSAQGSDTDIPLVLQPKGTGALQAQQTDSTATGGNARGANAVDFQTYTRSSAAQVASGLASSILGGARNTSNSIASVVVCGTDNTAGANSSFVGAGTTNTANGTSNAIVSGLNNSSSGTFAFIGAGQANTNAGFYGVVVGGQTNSGTSASAVTTQSATMNGTTAVTLSGSNANIKVGQLITGTSITSASGSTPYTYVAAISGTSLTLSQAASGSSTSTLSFYTPHGVVVGGGNNQATGSYSFIGGGGDAGTAANRNVASGTWSTVGGGARNTASGTGSFIGGGGTTGAAFFPSTASGSFSVIAGGANQLATSDGTFVGGGFGNNANGDYSVVNGGVYGTTRSITGNHVYSACNQPISGALGISQSALLILGTQTTDATATVLRSTSAPASGTNQIILPNNSAYYFKGSVIANVTGAANGAAWAFEGAIMRGANAGSTVLIGTPAINRVASTSGASAWTIALTADTSNGGLAVTVTGAASTTIRWVSSISTTEVTF